MLHSNLIEIRPKVVGLGLEFPEGAPAYDPVGNPVFVEIYRGTVSTVDRAGGVVRIVADVGGGPNSVIEATEDWGYQWLITQNGGVAGNWKSTRPRSPGIQGIGPSGVCSEIALKLDGRRLVSPNDLVLTGDSHLAFTDPGEGYSPRTRDAVGCVYLVSPVGRVERFDVGKVFPNGICTYGEDVIYTESYTRRIRRLGGGVIATLPAGHVPDGLAVDPRGLLWVACTGSGCITIVASEKEMVCLHLHGRTYLTNCSFSPDGALYITDAGDFRPNGAGGRLLRLPALECTKLVGHV